jgi:UDP-N-acetylmuramoyl-tripeptide--D-alanyl-D-alanine ligase
MNVEQIYQVYLQSRTVTTDSRNITPGCLFFAFKGEKFDGNAFAPQALAQGAALCVISDGRYRVDDRCVVVPDVLATLQALAKHHRQQMAVPVIGITGTNGKTTTKELVNAVLSRRYRTHATQGNHNNHLGVPLTLLATPANAEVAIVEMGANHPGEIAFLCGIADPDFGLITNVGRAHLEGFGSFEGVIKTKTELYRHLAAKGGKAFVNANNEILVREAAACHLETIGYGDCEAAQVRGHLVGSDPYMKFYMEDGDNVYSIQSQLLGNYNFDNAMAAAAVGRFFRVDYWDIKEAIEEYVPSNNRSQYKDTGRNVLILDCYNANPSSMGVALDNFESLQRSGKVAMLGGMRELGAESRAEHEKIVARLTARTDMKAVLVGAEFEFVQQKGSDRLLWFADVQAAVKYFEQNPLSGCTVLLKGSNGTRMWELEKVL